MAELYIITGPSGKQYIGATKKTASLRFSGHVTDSKRTKPRGSGSYLLNALRKYGAENFTFRTLLVGSRDFVFALEDAAIHSFGTRSPSGYNAQRGGSNGGDPTEDVRHRMGVSNRGKTIHPNLRASVKKHHADKKGTEEYRKSQGEAGKAAWSTPERKQKMTKAFAENNANPKIRKQRADKMREMRNDPESEFNRRRLVALRVNKQARLYNPNQLILL